MSYKTRKLVGFAYPTSDAAEHFGRGNNGCWIGKLLALHDDGRADVRAVIGPYDSEREAAEAVARNWPKAEWLASMRAQRPEAIEGLPG